MHLKIYPYCSKPHSAVYYYVLVFTNTLDGMANLLKNVVLTVPNRSIQCLITMDFNVVFPSKKVE